MKNYKLALVGATGLVGVTARKVLEEKNLPISEYVFFSSNKSAGTKINFLGKEYVVSELKEDSIDEVLDKDISLGFHSHNSLQLSFSNTKAFLGQNINRDLIIDSCLYGMGRGAGNLCTELIIKYLNDLYKSKYEILPVLKSIDFDLKPIYQNSPWGYSTPYYIAALYGCHPNYANYLVQQEISDEFIEKILSQIPNEKKLNFDRDFIELLAKKNFSSFVLV